MGFQSEPKGTLGFLLRLRREYEKQGPSSHFKHSSSCKGILTQLASSVTFSLKKGFYSQGKKSLKILVSF